MNNQNQIHETEWEVGWVIDRTPHHNNEYDDVNFINNIQYIINQHFHDEAPALAPALASATTDDFIPFEPFTIDIYVQEFLLLKEDRNCCICMESRENEQICQLNCHHKFCSKCTLSHIQRNRRQQPCCPLCRTNISNISVKTQKIRETFI